MLKLPKTERIMAGIPQVKGKEVNLHTGSYSGKEVPEKKKLPVSVYEGSSGKNSA